MPAGLAAPAVIAHRGASATWPENTLAAFEAAVRARADMIELDVRLTSDGGLVVMHDPDVGRTTEGRGLVRELTVADLQALHVPTLRDALDLLQGRAGVEIEIKDDPADGAVDALVAVLHELRFEAVLVSSFHAAALARVRGRDPGIATGLETDGAEALRAGLDHVVASGHRFVLPDAHSLIRAGREVIRLAHERGVGVGTWTVDDPQAIAELYAWGVDAVETNDPALAVPVRDAARIAAGPRTV
jgi:glycerophosphoryl diester phosphodiesterase